MQVDGSSCMDMQHKAAMKIQAGGGLRNIITSLVCFDTIKLIIRFPFQGFQIFHYSL